MVLILESERIKNNVNLLPWHQRATEVSKCVAGDSLYEGPEKAGGLARPLGCIRDSKILEMPDP